jgi:flagellar FliL protein
MLKVIITSIIYLTLSTASAQSGGGNSDYLLIEPPIVVNIYDSKRIKFLQVDTQVKIEDSSVIKLIELHKPAIRHSMLMLLSSQKLKDVKSVKGKEKLRKDVLLAIQKVLKENTGKEGVSELYFTGFIIQ